MKPSTRERLVWAWAAMVCAVQMVMEKRRRRRAREAWLADLELNMRRWFG